MMRAIASAHCQSPRDRPIDRKTTCHINITHVVTRNKKSCERRDTHSQGNCLTVMSSFCTHTGIESVYWSVYYTWLYCTGKWGCSWSTARVQGTYAIRDRQWDRQTNIQTYLSYR